MPAPPRPIAEPPRFVLEDTGGQLRGRRASLDAKRWARFRKGDVAVEDGKTKPVPTSAELDVDFDQEKGVMFREAWTSMRDHFHDSKMNGADWNGVRGEIEPRVAAARTYEEVRRLLNLMIGELNASHMAVNGPGATTELIRAAIRDTKDSSQCIEFILENNRLLQSS